MCFENLVERSISGNDHYVVSRIFDIGHRDWFGASLLSHDGKVIACAPRSLAEEIISKNSFSSSNPQYTGYRNMKENTGNRCVLCKLLLLDAICKSIDCLLLLSSFSIYS